MPKFRVSWYKISTHTPLARRDFCHWIVQINADNFYSHASCEA